MTQTDRDQIRTRAMPKEMPNPTILMNKEIRTDKINIRILKNTKIVLNKLITITIVGNGNNSVLDTSIMLLLNTNTTPT